MFASEVIVSIAVSYLHVCFHFHLFTLLVFPLTFQQNIASASNCVFMMKHSSWVTGGSVGLMQRSGKRQSSYNFGTGDNAFPWGAEFARGWHRL